MQNLQKNGVFYFHLQVAAAHRGRGPTLTHPLRSHFSPPRAPQGNILGAGDEWVRPAPLSLNEARERLSQRERRAIIACYRTLRPARGGAGYAAFAKFVRRAFPRIPSEVCKRLFVAFAAPGGPHGITAEQLLIALAVVLRGGARERATLLWAVYAQDEERLSRIAMERLCSLFSGETGASAAFSAKAVLDALFREGDPNAAEWRRFVNDVGVGASCHPICGSWLEKLRVGLIAEGAPLAGLGAEEPPADPPRVATPASTAAVRDGASSSSSDALTASASTASASTASATPPVEVQRVEVERVWVNDDALVVGQRWSAVPMGWWQQWCRASAFVYLGWERDADVECAAAWGPGVGPGVGPGAEHPGAAVAEPGALSIASLVRGAGILGGGRRQRSDGAPLAARKHAAAARTAASRRDERVWLLKKDLAMNHDFKLIAAPAWALLAAWYPPAPLAVPPLAVATGARAQPPTAAPAHGGGGGGSDGVVVGAGRALGLGRAHVTRSVIATSDGLELDLFLIDVTVRRLAALRAVPRGESQAEPGSDALSLVFSSKKATLADVVAAAAQRWWLKPERCRLWALAESEGSAYGEGSTDATGAADTVGAAPPHLVRRLDATLEMAEVLPGQVFELEVMSAGGQWMRAESTSAAGAASSGGVERLRAADEESRPKRPRLDSEERPVGLHNLGNTCFMNASLQCLARLPLLSSYFRSVEWQRDLNIDAKDGAKGEVAAAFAELLVSMRVVTARASARHGGGGGGGASEESHSSVAPRHFKNVIERFKPVFKGWKQQDAHEFVLAVILGLGEDLNRAAEKPCVLSVLLSSLFCLSLCPVLRAVSFFTQQTHTHTRAHAPPPSP